MNTPSQFWNWFKDNNKAYLLLDSVDEGVREILLNNFEEALHKYCDKIFFEIGGLPGEDQEIIITAQGNKNYFDKVEQLINAAPGIDNWIFIAFKQPTTGHIQSKWDGLELNTEDMYFIPLVNDTNSNLGIRIYLQNHDLIKNNEILTPLLYKMLDTIIGEKAFASDIDFIDTDQQPADLKDLYPILELSEYIEWRKARKSKSIG